MAIGVVVSPLRAAEFVTRNDHRNTKRQQERRDEVPLLPLAKLDDFGFITQAFRAAVPAQIGVRPVGVVLLVGAIMLTVVADKICECETVMGGHEIQARCRSAPAMTVHVARSRNPECQIAQTAFVTAPKFAHIVAELVVPFAPARRKASMPISVRAKIPRFSNQLHAGQNRVLLNAGEERRLGREFLLRSRQTDGEVEAKTVNMHVVDPIAQGIHDHLQDARMADIQRVAASRRVAITSLVLLETIIRGVVDPAKRKRRSKFVDFAGVIEDDVEDDFDTRGVKRLNGAAEIVGIAACQIARLGREEVDGIVAPVFPQSVLGQRPRRREGMYRHQLDSRNAEIAKVSDDIGVPESRHRSAHPFADTGMKHRVTAHVQFVDDAVRARRAQYLVAAPIERSVGYTAFGNEGGVVAHVEGQIRARIAKDISAMQFVPHERPAKRARVRIDQELVGIEAVAV